jgi:ATP-dependent RNA helicase DDX42
MPEVVSQVESDDEYIGDDISHLLQQGLEYDSEGNPLAGSRDKRIEPLPPVDHSAFKYAPVRFDFYKESSDARLRSESTVLELRQRLEVNVSGNGATASPPIETFDQLRNTFPSKLLDAIRSSGFLIPTAIQAQALPIALSGRDVIALAKTGSGKTLAFIWPIIVHVLDQPNMQVNDGPIALILSPTRELAMQIYIEAKKFLKLFNIRVCAIYGGGGKYEMKKALQEAPEVVVATPGRFIDLLQSKSTTLQRVTIVVLDEAGTVMNNSNLYNILFIIIVM